MKGPKNPKSKKYIFGKFYRIMQKKNFEKLLKIEGAPERRYIFGDVDLTKVEFSTF